MKTLGVIGGMGPAATLAFLARVQALTPAKGDADHIRVILDMNPRVPDRALEPEAAEAELGRMAERLMAMGADILAMPNNAAHAVAGRVAAAGPFIDMIGATVAAAAGTGARRVGLLATPGGEPIYEMVLNEADMNALLIEGPDRAAFAARIAGVKAGDLGEDVHTRMKQIAAELVARGAEALVVGCTEVPLLLGQGDVTVPLVDSAEVLARVCVDFCLSRNSAE